MRIFKALENPVPFFEKVYKLEKELQILKRYFIKHTKETI